MISSSLLVLRPRVPVVGGRTPVETRVDGPSGSRLSYETVSRFYRPLRGSHALRSTHLVRRVSLEVRVSFRSSINVPTTTSLFSFERKGPTPPILPTYQSVDLLSVRPDPDANKRPVR